MKYTLNNFFFNNLELSVAQKLFVLSLYSVVLFLPLSRPLVSWGICASLVFWLITADFKLKYTLLKKQPFVIITTIFYLLHIIGLFYTNNFKSANIDLILKLSILIFPIILCSTNYINDFFKWRVLKIFIFSCLSACLLCFFISVYKYSYSHDYSFFFYSKLSALMHVTYFSMYICLALACTILLLINRVNSSLEITLYSITAVIFVSFIVILASKTGQISLVLLVILFTCHLIYIRKQIFKAIILISSISFIVIVFYSIFNEATTSRMRLAERVVEASVSEKQTDNNSGESTGMRIIIIRSAIEIFKENILIGVGTGDSKDELIKKYIKNNAEIAVKRNYNAHNEYLQIAVTFGALGLVIFSLCFLYPLYISFITKDFLSIVFFIIMMLYFATESMLETQAGVVFFAFFSSLFMAENRNSKLIMLNRV